MCGRFTQRFSWRDVHYFMNLTGPALNLRSRYNVAPGQDVAAVRTAEDGRRLSMLRWGLIPFWSREPNIGFRMINARAETVAGKPAFRAAYRARWPTGRRATWWRAARYRPCRRTRPWPQSTTACR